MIPPRRTALRLCAIVARPAAILLITVATVVAAIAQQNPNGSVRVKVTDGNQRPVATAACSVLRSDGTPVAVAKVNDQGEAVVSGLSPGAYTLVVESSGFAAFRRGDIVVTGSAPVEVAVELAVASVAENVTVSAASELETDVSVGSSTPNGVLKTETLKRLPLASARVADALPLLPGVIRTSTGEISIKGASEQQSALLVNGMNSGDPARGNFRLNLPIDSVESVQVFQHPYTVEFGQFTGGVTQIETKRGGDRLHFELNDFLPDLRFRRGGVRGIAEDRPRLNVSGPIIADRLYFSQSLSYTFAREQVRGLSYPFDETRTEAVSSFTQFDLTLSSRHSQTFTLGVFPERDRYVGLDYFRPQPVTPDYRQGDVVFAARDRYEIGGGLLESSISFMRFHGNVRGQGTADQTLTPTVEQGNYFATQDWRSRRFEVFEVYTFPQKHFLGGSHEIKLGFDFNSVRNELDYSARPVNIVRENGTLAERIVFNGSLPIRALNREYAGFIQDRWMVRPNLSVDLGLRFEDQRIANESNLSPRAGFAWSPFGGDGTVIRGGIGLFYDKVPLNIRSFRRYPSRTVTRYAADGRTAIDSISFSNVLVETAPIAPLDFRRSNRNAGFVPESLTWNFQVDQNVRPWLLLRANFTDSHTTHLYIVNPELDYLGQSAVVLRSAGDADYRALELTARFKLQEKNAIYVSYVRSRARGDLNDFNSYFGDVGAPIIRPNQYSNLPFDAPNRFVAWGTISLPRRFTISPIFEVRSGFPYSVRDSEQNFVGERNSDRTRFPKFLALDAEIAKEIQVTKKYAVRLSLNVFNITNHFNPRDVRANTADPGFGQFFASYRRYFTGGFDILF